MKYQPLKSQGITLETCQRFNYAVGMVDDQPAHVATVCDPQGQPVCEKIIRKDGSSALNGDETALYGKNLWGGSHRRQLVIFQAPLDALAFAQATSFASPVVAAWSTEVLKANLEWVCGFDRVVISDSLKDALELLPSKKTYVMHAAKPLGELLRDNLTKAIQDTIENARQFRPDGFIAMDTLWDLVSTPLPFSTVRYPWDAMNEMTYGIRPGEIMIVAAGSGVGKSEVVSQVAHCLMGQNKKTLLCFLEEDARKTAQRFLSLSIGRRIHLEEALGKTLDLKEGKKAFDATFGTGLLEVYDAGDWDYEIDDLIAKIRIAVKSMGCEFVILDHITILFEGVSDKDQASYIARGMKKLKQAAKALNIGIFCVTHLKRPEGKGHEEGAQTSVSQFKGSTAIAQLSDIAFGIERDKSGERPNIVTLRILKNRFSGDEGFCCELEFNKTTGLLTQLPKTTTTTQEPYRVHTDEADYWRKQNIQRPDLEQTEAF